MMLGRLILLTLLLLALHGRGVPGTHANGFETISLVEIRADVVALAAAPMEGRDSPSVGLERAADYVEQRLREAGLTGGADEEGAFRYPFTLRRPAPVEDSCQLESMAQDARAFVLGQDFVPVWRCEGRASGETIFLGFGIRNDSEKYNDLRGDLKGKVAVILEGEPRHKRKFNGPEVTSAADLYTKCRRLLDEGVVGVLVVRREPESNGMGKLRLPTPEPAGLNFRSSWAVWADGIQLPSRTIALPVHEITSAVASELLGMDVSAQAAKIDRSGKPMRKPPTGATVTLRADCEERLVSMDNVVGLIRGSDEVLADEYVVIGAHYDHVGVDSRGRIGFGADDNASGTAAMLEVAEALAAAGPRRSILVCAFAAEEDGLRGSQAFANRLPVPTESVVAMVNLDMVGRGEPNEVVAIGLLQNPKMEKVIDRALKLRNTRIKKVVRRRGDELFRRSDHYNFHRIGVPTLFFFEDLPISRNADYHTWRDTIDQVDFEKVTRVAQLTFNVCWLLANDDKRLPSPR